MLNLIQILFLLNHNIINNDPIGKTYKAILSETCFEMTKGGCMLYKYQILNFKKDSVTISFQERYNCSIQNNITNQFQEQKGKNYTWNIQNENINIIGLNDFEKLTIINSKLIGTTKITKQNIVFILEP